jgi:ABC-type nickel/cobalt efflux system permease component RcnA
MENSGMRMMKLMSAVLIAGVLVVTGCGRQTTAPTAKESAAKVNQPAKDETAKTDKHDHDDHDHDQIASTEKTADKKGTDHDHSGWWCAEHGVPEEKCSQCSSKVAADCQKKGDWCAEHDRAKSQCFICNPKLKETFAAQYRAKLGKEPPALEEKEEKAEKKS